MKAEPSYLRRDKIATCLTVSLHQQILQEKNPNVDYYIVFLSKRTGSPKHYETNFFSLVILIHTCDGICN